MSAHKSGHAERKKMINRHHPIPLTQQSRLLRLSRNSLYYEPHPTSERDLRLMGKIDKLHTARPFADSRMLRDMLRLERQRIRGATLAQREV